MRLHAITNPSSELADDPDLAMTALRKGDRARVYQSPVTGEEEAR